MFVFGTVYTYLQNREIISHCRILMEHEILVDVIKIVESFRDDEILQFLSSFIQLLQLNVHTADIVAVG